MKRKIVTALLCTFCMTVNPMTAMAEENKSAAETEVKEDENAEEAEAQETAEGSEKITEEDAVDEAAVTAGRKRRGAQTDDLTGSDQSDLRQFRNF